jgi:diketogulonate reductase-like aldo/keto reductase
MRAGSNGEERSRTLQGGVQIPLLGLGVWLLEDGDETERSVNWALEAGYRHIDTAQNYGNETSVGRAIRASGLRREELFVTTKFLPGSGRPDDQAERSLERLGIDQVDLYLVHWPKGGPTRAWKGMERALERELTRAIGVSNFDLGELSKVIETADVRPALNQVDFSPFRFRRRLLAGCVERGVAVEAYSPLTHGRDLADPVLGAIAEQVGRTPAQVMLRWAIQRGVGVVPKSSHRERIVENAAIFDFELEADQVSALDGLDLSDGSAQATDGKWWTARGRARSFAARLARPLRG